jgi:hypothetical protein
MYRNCHRHEEADGGQVAERQDLVARHHDGDKNGQRDERSGWRRPPRYGQAAAPGRDQSEILAAKFGLQTFTRLFGNRRSGHP